MTSPVIMEDEDDRELDHRPVCTEENPGIVDISGR